MPALRSSCSLELPDDTTVVVDGRRFEIAGTITVAFDFVDQGIGSYEYWGATGFDSQMGAEDAEVTDLELDAIEPVIPEMRQKALVVPHAKLVKALMHKMDHDKEFEDWVYARLEPIDYTI